METEELSTLGTTLFSRFGRTGDEADLDKAIDCFRGVADATLEDHPSRSVRLSNLGAVLRVRFEFTGQLADLDEAITVGRLAVETTPDGHPGRPRMLSNLGTAFCARFEVTGLRPDLDQAITCFRAAISGISAAEPYLTGMRSNLGGALQLRYELAGQLADLDEAIDAGQEAVDATQEGHLDRPGYLSNLGAALRARFERTGLQADLDLAIAAGQVAVDSTPDGDPHRPGRLSNLGIALEARFERSGQQADLDQAAARLQAAVAATSAGHPARPRHLSNLGAVLRARFERAGQQPDLDLAVASGREAVEVIPPGHSERPGCLSSLAATMGTKFRHTGRLPDLDQAISCLREAVAATPPGHPDRPGYLSNLGVALRVRFDKTGQRLDLDEAISIGREAVHLNPADHQDRPVLLASLGAALRARFDRTGQRPDLSEALQVFREGADVLTAAPARRMAAAQGWGRCALLAGNQDDALAAYTTAIELLPLAAWHGLDQPTREHHLREWAGLGSEAAGAAIAAGQPARAVELLEAGRSVVWTQASHLRQDLAALREHAPDLAVVLEASRGVLNTSATSLMADLDRPGDYEQALAAERQMLARRRKAARDWDEAVNQTRGITGFGRFLLPAPFAGLRAAATAGPVVLVNISPYASQALIITRPDGSAGAGVAIADLPDAPIAAVEQHADALWAILNRRSDPHADLAAKKDGSSAVFDILTWCWEAICEPALTVLGYRSWPQGVIGNWPRVWWCPTGPATRLPLHAAGRYPRTVAEYRALGEEAALADCVPGRVISSYTPTLTALSSARAQSAPGQVRQLAVGVTEAPGTSRLPGVRAELEIVAGFLPAPEHATQLVGPAATRSAVIEALPGHSWLHLSGHSIQYSDDASRSAFLLHDEPLTLADLAALNLEGTDLAYLASCHTASSDPLLPDEALHLTGALQLIGYRHVLATLWSIPDADAIAMAGTAYARLIRADPDHPGPADGPQAARAPYAMHDAVARLRRARLADPLRWAPYLHFGP